MRIFFALFPVLLTLSGCASSAPIAGLPVVETRIADESVLPRTLELSGTLRPAEETTVSAKGAGRIAAIFVAEGQRVSAGAPIARLDGAEALAASSAVAKNLQTAIAARDSLVALYAQRIAAAERALDLAKSTTAAQTVVAETAAAATKSDRQNDAISAITSAAIATQNAETLLDSILGATPARATQNDSFESFLGSRTPQTKTDATDALLLFVGRADAFLARWNAEISGKIPTAEIVSSVLLDAETALVAAKTALEKSFSMLGATLPGGGLTDAQIVEWKSGIAAAGDQISALQKSIGLLRGGSLATESSTAISEKTAENVRVQSAAAIENASLALATLARERDAKLAEADGSIAALSGQAGISAVALANASVTASISGVITEKLAEVGEVVAPGTPIAMIANDSSLKLVSGVSDSVASVLAVGQTATLEIDAVKGKTLTATLSRIDPTADSVSKKITVEFRIANGDRSLKSGLFARVLLDLPQIAGLIVPASAVVSLYGKHFVFVFFDGKAIRREVTLGDRTENAIAITSGIVPSEMVIVKGQRTLRDLEAVKVFEKRDSAGGTVLP